jgi:hypothetical protein
VSNLKDLVDHIVPIFDAYPCLTRKSAQYLLWRETLLARKSGSPIRERPVISKDIAGGSLTTDQILAHLILITG